MKKFLYFAALCCFLFWWCSDDDNQSSSSNYAASSNSNQNDNFQFAGTYTVLTNYENQKDVTPYYSAIDRVNGKQKKQYATYEAFRGYSKFIFLNDGRVVFQGGDKSASPEPRIIGKIDQISNGAILVTITDYCMYNIISQNASIIRRINQWDRLVFDRKLNAIMELDEYNNSDVVRPRFIAPFNYSPTTNL